MSDPAKPGILDRLRARYGWFGHLMRAYERFDKRNGGFFAAGLTYYTIFALFPLLMVGFAVVGFTLARRPQLLNTIDDHIRSQVTGALGDQLLDLINSAIDARASIGVIGLATAVWAGLGWISHLRQALTEMWWEHRISSPGFLRNKLSDLLAMLGTFAVTLGTVVITTLGHAAPMGAMLKWLGIPEFTVFDWLFLLFSIALSVLVSWLLFTWMIARLPREKVSLVESARAGFVAAAGFELFKQVGSIYLKVVLRSPAGATFGPVLGLMVFAYITAYLVLFCTAWAATASDDPRDRHVYPPAPAIIAPRVQLDEGLSTRQALTAMGLGAVGALAFSRLTRWLR
ncbi:inner membrane protein YhjD [Mycobacterium parmense]|uniref:Inner membrane protein YhjD n=1 Tax=Mycobacterium parmense TaxID=185642 RepID=A0A7I7YUV9_9MYCO|nr:inner membrane protein YhjD [Mycobacterium parmense]MCV7350911.1 inner membrane protein YhjD [Mycobacterium parmense]ORW52573.1 inner membrane protein YhjD [Mycobacterium parmense]BBZ45655.1 inner membrane protein YhjD [Mycobacterium parmense]